MINDAPKKGATFLTLLASAIFGLAWGTVIVSFASSIGIFNVSNSAG